MKPLNLLPNKQNVQIGAIDFNVLAASVSLNLTASVAQTVPIPSTAFYAQFEYGSGESVWVSPDVISLAAPGTQQNDRSSINPAVRILGPTLAESITTLKFLSENDARCKVNFYLR